MRKFPKGYLKEEKEYTKEALYNFYNCDDPIQKEIYREIVLKERKEFAKLKDV